MDKGNVQINGIFDKIYIFLLFYLRKLVEMYCFISKRISDT